MKTPIYLDFNIESTYLMSNELDLNKEDPIDLYTSNLLASPPYLNFQFVLAPRYYLKIYSPKDQNLSTIKIPIHKSPASHLKNKARILLSPSLSYGINSSYKVEYWEWVPNIGYTQPPSKTLIKTEYWNIPTLDNNYRVHLPFHLHLNEYQFYINNYNYNVNRLISEQIVVLRSVDNINNKVFDIIDPTKSFIFAFDLKNIISFEETIETENLIFNEETQAWTFSKKLINSTLIRNLNEVDGNVINGIVTTTINYINPFTNTDVLINECF